jgi:hypothetical protein
METGSNGLVAFWSDIDPSYIDRYRQWHSIEHIPERVAISGFNTGQRYTRVYDGRMFFMYYDTSSPEVLKSEAYLDALDHPTPWTSESLQYFRNPLRNLYRKLREDGIEPASASKFIQCARFNCTDSPQAAASKVCLDVVRIMSADGASRVRLYEVDQVATKVKTKERSIYGSQLEEQRYLAIAEKTSCDSREGMEALETSLRSLGTVDLALDLYGLEFSLRAAGAAN